MKVYTPLLYACILLAPPLLDAIPTAPSGVSAGSPTGNSLTVSWTDNSDDETGFRILRSRSQDSDFVEVGVVPANTTSFTARNLSSEETFYFRVHAFNAEGDSAAAGPATGTTLISASVGTNWVWWEAEDYDSTNLPSTNSSLSPDTPAEIAVLSGGSGVGYDSPGGETSYTYTITYTVNFPVTGAYSFFARKPWNYSWFGWRIDDGPLMLEVTDNQRQEDIDYIPNFPMSWVYAGTQEVEAGEHTFTVVLDPSQFAEPPGNAAAINNYFYDAFFATTGAFAASGKQKPNEKLALAEAGKWAFEPGADPLTHESLLDLRYLNEDVAGQSGFVTKQGDTFILGNGEPVRFWGVVQGNVSGNFATMREHGEFLAKRGVNMVRFHKSFFDNSNPDINYVDPILLDNLHRLVAAYKQAGIYIKSSHFFILSWRINPAWNIPGYTEEFTNRAPFANMFWSEELTEAYKEWMRTIYLTENPYNGLTLAEDPAVAIIELQNEDNVFFWTFTPDDLPEIQQQDLESQFYDFIIAKYGSMDDAETAWGGAVNLGRDNLAEGRLEVTNAWGLGFGEINDNPSGRRRADTVEFMGELQYNWYADMAEFMRNEIGIQCTISASNWRTARDVALHDLELYTYTATDVIDLHNYVSPGAVNAERSWVVETGNVFTRSPLVYQPDLMSTAYHQVKDHPSFISEFTWVNPTEYGAEGPLMIASTAMMNDIDGLTWFSVENNGWTKSVDKWPTESPTLMGQFPGAALIYRRGDLKLAPVVVAEGRALESIYQRELSIITQGAGFDPTRDEGVGGSGDDIPGAVDTQAYLVGKVEVNFAGDEDVIAEELLDSRIDRENGTLRNAHEELFFDTSAGLMTLDTPRSQGATGFLQDAGVIDLSKAQFNSQNIFGALLVTSLDDRPIGYSQKLLIQAATDDKPYGYTTEPTTMDIEGVGTVDAERITSMGSLPINVRNIEATVLLKGITAEHAPVVQTLDANGYPISTPITRFVEEGLEITLSKHALYTHVSLGNTGTFMDTFERQEGDWVYAEWLGWMHLVGHDANWMYHYRHGWMWIVPVNAEAFWAYHPDFGWMYHTSVAPRYMYWANETEWIRYLRGSGPTRVFNSESRGNFFPPNT